MNELQLSKDLTVITTEIQSYKQVAGQAIFEIGRRLKYVKENDLVHGEWGRWLEKIQLSRGQATKFITVYEELGVNDSTWNKIGTQALYHIATLPQEEREKEHVTSKGETKTVDEMTVRELQELKKQLKETKQAKQQAESQAELERQERERLEKENRELSNQKPKVITEQVIKEVTPKHIESEIEQLKRMVESSNQAFKQAEEELKGYRLKNTSNFDEEEAEKELKKLRFEAEKSVLRLTVKVNRFLEEISPFGYMEGEIATSSTPTKEQLQGSLEHLKNFIRKMETSLKGRIEI